MKQLYSFALAVLVGSCGVGCAAAPPAAETSCRDVASPDATVRTYCGSPEQWAEFDSAIARVDQGISCRKRNTPRELCLFARQWEVVDARRGPEQSGFGDAARVSAMSLSNTEVNLAVQHALTQPGGSPTPPAP